MPATYMIGHGASIVFGTSGFVAPLRMIGATQATRGKVEVGHLGVARKAYVPEGLSDPGEFELEFLFNFLTDDWDDYFPDIDGAPEVITISYPKPSGYATPAKLTGNGFFVAAGTPEIASDALAIGSGTVAWEGGDAKPLLSVAVAS